MFYLLLTTLVFAISDSLWKIPLRYVDSHVCIFFRNLLTTLLFGLVWWAFPEERSPDAEDFGRAVITSVVAYGGLYFFAKAQKHILLAVLVHILVFGQVLQFLIGVLYWGEEASTKKICIFMLSLISSAFLAAKEQETKKISFRNKGAIYGLLAATFWSISYSFFKYHTEKLGAIRFGFVLEATAVVMSVLVHLFRTKSLQLLPETKKIRRAFPTIALIGFLGFVGVYATNKGYEEVGISGAVIIGGVAGVIPIVLGWLLYSEIPQKHQFIGIFIAMVVFILLKVW